MSAKKMVRKYLLFTKPCADNGEEYIRQTACPSSPIMSVPKLIAITDEGIRIVMAVRRIVTI